MAESIAGFVTDLGIQIAVALMASVALVLS